MVYNTLKPHLQYFQKELLFNSKSLRFLKNNYQGPTFVYDLDLLQNRFEVLRENLPGVDIHFAIKANPDLRLLHRLANLGCGADVVSGGEMRRALQAGIPANRIIFSGVAKTHGEIQSAIESQIQQMNVESLPELARIGAIATSLQQKISVALRINPDIEVKTHKYITTGFRENKFGLDLEVLPEAIEILKKYQQYVQLRGISLHLGSQILEFSGFKEALVRSKKVFQELKAEFATCDRFDFGGGLGILYDEVAVDKEYALLQEYSQIIFTELKSLQEQGVLLQTEPGRWLVAHAGILVCQVQYIKKTPYKSFVIVDSGMNHLLRPSLYEAYHWMTPLEMNSDQKIEVDVVGPICESSDFFGKGRLLPMVQELDLMVVADCGAYGASMSSDYNLQARAAEIVI